MNEYERVELMMADMASAARGIAQDSDPVGYFSWRKSCRVFRDHLAATNAHWRPVFATCAAEIITEAVGDGMASSSALMLCAGWLDLLREEVTA